MARHDPGDAATTRRGSVVDDAGRATLMVFSEQGMAQHALAGATQVVVGRSSRCDVVVDHPSVSRQHLRITLWPQTFVEDLGSANGTRVAGVALPPGERVPLAPGVLIEIGSLALALKSQRRADDPAAGPDAPGPDAPDMPQLLRLVERFARTNLTILISGETGTGKEVMAETIHRASLRAERPLLRLNCAAFTESVLESELFGHERGAFTGAVAPKPGLLEMASGGTVFLDEIADLSPPAQAKVLRVLEERKVWRVGATAPREIDVRFVAASHRDLDAAVAKGAFRQDLLFRLNAITVRVPPLRQRRDEIAPLAEAFVAEASAAMGRAEPPRISPEARAALEAYAWPGNIRELRNTVTRAVAICDEPVLTPAHIGLPRAAGGASVAPAQPSRPASAAPPGALRREVEAVEYDRITAALTACGGNQKRAAEMLGIARNTLAARIERLGIDVARTRPRR